MWYGKDKKGGGFLKKYFSHLVKKEVIVQNLITIETLDITSGFSYPEEAHEFYELAYVDSGLIVCFTEHGDLRLDQGDLLLIPPYRRHSYSASGEQSAAIFIICFRSHSEYLSILDKKFSLDKDSKRMISEIVKESKNAFVFPFDKKLKLLAEPLFGAQQMVENNIERLLIHLIRARISKNEDIVFVMNSIELEHSLSNDIIQFLKSHIYDALSLEQISRQTYYSKTFLNNIFKKNTGMPIMKYYTALKIQESKKLLRKNLPVAAVASRLSFESSTYFTKVFKKHAGMTPTAYKKTIL